MLTFRLYRQLLQAVVQVVAAVLLSELQVALGQAKKTCCNRT